MEKVAVQRGFTTTFNSLEKGGRSIITKDTLLPILLEKALEEKEIAYDTETTGLSHVTDSIVGVSLYLPKNDLGVYLNFDHLGEQLDKQETMRILKTIFEREESLLIAHNHKFDLNMVRNYHIDYGHKHKTRNIADCMLLSWLIDENRPSNSLKELEESILGIEMVDLTKKEKRDMVNVPVEKAGHYAIADAMYTYNLWQVEYPKIVKEKLEEVYWKVLMPMLVVLANMERRGIDIDTEHLKTIQEKVVSEMEQIDEKIKSRVGFDFNINSGDQLGKVLYEHLGFPILGTTGTGKPKTDKPVLGKLAAKSSQKYDIVRDILRYKELRTVRSTFVDGLLDKIASNGKLYSSFNQHVTVTGRLSSSGPNFQNLPAGNISREVIPESSIKSFLDNNILPFQDKENTWYVDWKVRDAFTAGDSENYTLVVADLSQIELRILAHFSKDRVLTSSFINGEDIHARTASEVFDESYESIVEATKAEEATQEQKRLIKLRKSSKAINFGMNNAELKPLSYR